MLVVDDEPANVLALRALLTSWKLRDVQTTTDPREALALCETSPPDLVMLDLQMPRMDGFAVLEQLRSRLRGPIALPVIVLTADMSIETRRRALAAGARDFVTKPFDPEEVRLRVCNLLEMRALQLQHAASEAALEARVRRRTAELEGAQMEMLQRLALAAEFRDDSTGEHTQRVGRTSRLIAEALGLPREEVERIGLSAPLHDVGKIAVSDTILLKRGALTAGERRTMQRHTVIGGRMLRGSGSQLLQTAERVALTHHERWDGTGYPHGVAGPDIPVPGRIVAVADVFDALTHERPYKAPWPVEQAVEEIASERGRRFEPRVVDAFLELEHAALL
ncbi:MAG TPA: HD domain-containing phosphohydrolase [Capillimicrobium sp.]